MDGLPIRLPAVLTALLLAVPLPLLAQESSPAQEEGFALPYAAEREALGYDPEGVEYRRNTLEDFQVLFVSSTPFTALASFGLAALTSKVFRGEFSVTGDYRTAAFVGAGVGSLAVAWYSLPRGPGGPPKTVSAMEVRIPLLAANF